MHAGTAAQGGNCYPAPYAVSGLTGVTQLALVRIVQGPDQPFAVSLSQQMCALVLKGLGLPAAEADQIAAQASDAIVRTSPRSNPS